MTLADAERDLEWWLDRFYEAAAEGMDVLEFVRQALAGSFGPVTAELLLALVDAVEAIVLTNIATRLEEAPGLAAEAEAAAEGERERFRLAREWIRQRAP